MAIGSYINIPVLQRKAAANAMRKYQGAKSSIIATPYRFLSREQIALRKSRQWMTEVAAAWALLDAPTQAIWKSYAANILRNGWQLFMQEYCYRKKYDLSIPPTPNEYHQMMGLKISNASGSGIVKAWRYDIAVTGPISITFSYYKMQHSATSGLPFQVKAEAFYFNQGENLSESYLFEAPAGDVDWNTINFSFGTAGRYYFELIVSFELNDYDADVILDNFLIEDNIGVVVTEPWHIKAGKEWVYQIRTRKMGWEFAPAIGAPNFEVVYTGS